MRQWIFGALAAVLFASNASAADGVIEINQARALAGGVTPADTPGFPVTLNLPGSYRLTGNLLVGATSAIVITSIQVTLDLGGFSINGPNACTGYPPTSCTTVNGPVGILSDQFFVVVRNGNVLSMNGAGISLAGGSSVVEDIRSLGNGGPGALVGQFGTVRHSSFAVNAGGGVSLDYGARVEDSEAHGNSGNGFNFIGAGGAGLAIRNFALQNGGFGISANTDVVLTLNSASGNIGAPIDFLGAKSRGDNLCNGVFC